MSSTLTAVFANILVREGDRFKVPETNVTKRMRERRECFRRQYSDYEMFGVEVMYSFAEVAMVTVGYV